MQVLQAAGNGFFFNPVQEIIWSTYNIEMICIATLKQSVLRTYENKIENINN